MSRAWKHLLMIPGIGVPLLPKLACPLCWPSYAGLLGSLGLGLLISGKYLLPLTGVFLVLTLGAFAFGAKRRHGYGPLGLGIVSRGGVLLGKFAWESKPTMYAAVGLLVSRRYGTAGLIELGQLWHILALALAVCRRPFSADGTHFEADN